MEKIIENAVGRKLTEKEIHYIMWLERMDFETIEVFTNLFIEATNKKK